MFEEEEETNLFICVVDKKLEGGNNKTYAEAIRQQNQIDK